MRSAGIVFLMRSLAAAALLLAWVTAAAAQVPAKPAELAGAWGDRGDGTFVNPVLPADYSDLDAIRVDGDFYAISSTLHLAPGMAVLHSRDLVNWRLIGHAVDDVSAINPELNWDRMGQYGRGVWAGAIRRHAGRYWIYFGAPDDGIFVTTAQNPAGPWTPLHCVWKTSGWNDTCPFWDDDGQGYLVTTNFARDPRDGKSYNIHLFKLTPDGKSLVPGFDVILYQARGSEASKLYKIDGRYYHYFSEVRREGRVAMMRRSSSLEGPWETRQLNHVRSGVDDEPNQGGLIELKDGTWWFVTHQGTGTWEGRTMCLLPVAWVDGWPVIGQPGDDGIGVMQWSAAKPISGGAWQKPQTDDEFDAPQLGVQWEWNHQPRAEKWSLTERPGMLRLHAFRPLRAGDLKTAGNVLSQRTFRTHASQVTVRLDVSGMADGQYAGLCHFARGYSALGVRMASDERRLVHSDGGKLLEGPALDGKWLWLRSEWGLDGVSRYSYSADGQSFEPFGPTHQAAFGHYRGDRIGVFSFNDAGDAGYVDVDWFHYEMSRGPSAAEPAGSAE